MGRAKHIAQTLQSGTYSRQVITSPHNQSSQGEFKWEHQAPKAKSASIIKAIHNQERKPETLLTRGLICIGRKQQFSLHFLQDATPHWRSGALQSYLGRRLRPTSRGPLVNQPFLGDNRVSPHHHRNCSNTMHCTFVLGQVLEASQAMG